MTSNYNRKSASSGSRKAPTRKRGATVSSRASSRGRKQSAPRNPRTKASTRKAEQGSYHAIAGGRYAPSKRNASSRQRLTSVRVGDLDRAERHQRARVTYQRYILRFVLLAFVVAALIVGAVAMYYSNLFAIEDVTVTGIEHLTVEDMTTMADVPSETTLLRVDAAGIRSRLLENAWVSDAEVKRIFPNTLELAVTERTISAVVSVPTNDAKSTKKWAIAANHMWLMPLPEQDSEQGKKTSAKIYEEAETALAIVDVPYGTKANIGSYCSDNNVNNALDIVSGMTTELAEQVKSVSATGPEETKLVLEDNREIAFGKAENIRDKERVALKIMEEHPDVVYINVRVVDRPTWRSL